LTQSESTDDTRRDAERTGGQLPHSDLTSRTAKQPAVAASPSTGSSESTKRASADRAGTTQQSSGANRPKPDAASARVDHPSRERSPDARTSSHGEPSSSDGSSSGRSSTDRAAPDRPSPDHPSDALASSRREETAARDSSSRTSTSRSDGTSEALRSLIACVEQLVREIPRGAAARFEGATEDLRKARRALDGATSGASLASPGVRFEGSKAIPTSSRGGDGGASEGSSSADRSDEIRPSATPPIKGGR